MGYLSSCNAKSAIATCQCDPHSWDLNTQTFFNNHNKLPQIREFQYSDLVAATNGFSPDSFLGKGSHGSVYRATLDGGKLIAAVKTTKLKNKPPSLSNHRSRNRNSNRNRNHSPNCSSPAENEIEILSRVRNPNRLVNLIGFSADSDHNKLIVVQYMPNGSLYDLLHTAPKPPGWSRRLRYALQVAKAVRSLHGSEPPVIHRDIKSSNVLMDEDWNARVGDFGLALRGHMEDDRVRSTPPAGTMGYLDPCYLAPEDVSAKSDVFSFGILLLEIVSGRNAIDVRYSPPSVVDWAVPLIKKGEFLGICDPRVTTPSDRRVVEEVAVLAARCVRSKPEKRPAMTEVVEGLKQARKRMEASPLWRSVKRLRRRRSGEQVRRSGSRRNGKVSSVVGVEDENHEIMIMSSESRNRKNQVGRSKSMGCDSEMMRMEFNSKFVIRSGGVGMMRLNKSRSMGFNKIDPSIIQSAETMASVDNKLLETPLVDAIGLQ